jgi:Transposase DDE domain
LDSADRQASAQVGEGASGRGAAALGGLHRVLPRRWVIERTIAWIMRNRRMSRDYEFLAQTTEALVYVAMIRLMVRRLAKAAA